MEHLRKELDVLLAKSPNGPEVRDKLKSLVSLYPFNEYEYIISYLLAKDVLTFENYLKLRDEYINRNPYLSIFEIGAPRNFGETWAQEHLKGLVPDLEKPTQEIDPGYSGQYDFHLDGKIRIEVKASRAVDAGSNAPLPVKALSSDSEKNFVMNFQQLKPELCDVFVWIAVWRNIIQYWMLSSHAVRNNQYYSPGQRRGNVGEGQLHIKQDNIHQFDQYEVQSDQIKRAIREAFRRQPD